MLKIEYGSTFELTNLLKNHPKEVGKAHKLYAQANRKVDDAKMELEIFIAEFVKEVCEQRKVPASAKQEIRRAEVQLDPRWKKLTKKLNEATENMLILKGRINGLYDRRSMLERISRFEERFMYDGNTIYRDNRGSDRKVNDASEGIELPPF